MQWLLYQAKVFLKIGMSAQPASYPYWRILLCYSLLGGAVGGLITSLFNFFAYLFADPFHDILDIILTIASAMLIGAVIGLIPALLTALVIILRRMTLTYWVDYCKLFAIGFGSSALFTLALIAIDAGLAPHYDPKYMPLQDYGLIPYMGIIGGLSAVILARFTLPKIAKTPISHH